MITYTSEDSENSEVFTANYTRIYKLQGGAAQTGILRVQTRVNINAVRTAKHSGRIFRSSYYKRNFTETLEQATRIFNTPSQACESRTTKHRA